VEKRRRSEGSECKRMSGGEVYKKGMKGGLEIEEEKEERRHGR